MSHEGTWEEKRRAFFATDPKCKECGRDLDHYSRTMLCTKCQKIKYRKKGVLCSQKWRDKNREKVRAYQKNYYLKNRDAISEQKKIRYQEKKRCR